VERSHRVDDEEFYQLLDKNGIGDDIHLFNEKLREWEDYYKEKVGGEAGIRTLGRTLKALQRFSKPPPSASRPPHRASASIREIGTYAATLAHE
jgi:hypothetical protein